jgi:multimeric flavodoxin WrbA
VTDTSTLLIVYHTQSGGTQALAERAARGAASVEEMSVLVRRAADATAEDVLAASGLLLGTPENFGYMSGMLKDFFDRVFYPCEDKVAGRPYSVFVCAGGDGTGAMREVDRIVTGWRMRKVHDGVIARRVGGMAGSSRGHLAEDDLARAEELGATLAAGIAFRTF